MPGLVSFTHWVKIIYRLYGGATLLIEPLRPHQPGTLNVEPINPEFIFRLPCLGEGHIFSLQVFECN